MSVNSSMGHATQLGVKKESSYGTAVVVDTRLVFVSETMAKRGVIVERDGLRGTRAHVSEDTRTGPYSVAGQVVLEPTPEDLAVLFPFILGADASGTTFALAETLPSFTLVVDRVAKVFTYAGCKVARATFSGSSGSLLRLVLDIVAQSESVGNAGTFPSLTASITQPYIFHDLVMTLQSAAKKLASFELTIDNGLITDRFLNSTTIVSLPEGDRVITLGVVVPYSTGTGTTGNTDLYAQALAGAAGSLVFTNAGYSTTFNFGTLQVPDNSPTAAGRGEIPLNLEMVARRVSSTPELNVIHDSTA